DRLAVLCPDVPIRGSGVTDASLVTLSHETGVPYFVRGGRFTIVDHAGHDDRFIPLAARAGDDWVPRTPLPVERIARSRALYVAPRRGLIQSSLVPEHVFVVSLQKPHRAHGPGIPCPQLADREDRVLVAGSPLDLRQDRGCPEEELNNRCQDECRA